MAQIQVNNVTTGYDPSVSALRDIHLQLPHGQLGVVIGESGSGKTTLLRVLAGLNSTSWMLGSVHFDDRDVTALPPEQRRVGFVSQDYALYDHLTVDGNIRLPLEFRDRCTSRVRQLTAALLSACGFTGLSRRAAGISATLHARHTETIREIAEMLEIAPLLARSALKLSGGQRQRVAIARAIVRQQGLDLWLLDEPLSSLDPQLRCDLVVQLKRLQRRLGITTVVVTHSQSEALSLGDRIFVLRQGKLEQADSPDRLVDYPRNLHVARFLATMGMLVLPGQMRASTMGPCLSTPVGLVPLPPEFARTRPSEEEQLQVAIRAEHITAVPATRSADDALSARIELLLPNERGLFAQGRCDDGTEVRFTIAAHFAARPGDQSKLMVDRDRVLVFDRQGELLWPIAK